MRKLILFTLMLYACNTCACNGKFVNPITDICWSCIFPIKIGGISLAGGSDALDSPKSPVCLCMHDVGGVKLPVPGITLGFWEPVRLIDITRTPYCMVGLGGISFSEDHLKQTTKNNIDNKMAFYHTHYYIYPLIYWLELLTDVGCLEVGSFDVGYMSEYDPLYDDEIMANILNAESILFANPIAQTACIADGLKAAIGQPINAMYWCAGAQGCIYPFTGYVAGAGGGVQASSLLATRIIAKMHRLYLAHETSYNPALPEIGDESSLCTKRYLPFIKKSQYKLQMTYPIAASSAGGCNALGKSDALFNSFKEFPVQGEDWGYVLWRKKDCCFL